MMTAIVMAGRTGAAFAAEIGTMTVNREIDALTTMDVDPMEFLVLPRMIALSLMMPLLCLYADAMGILGGAVIGTSMLDLSWTTYFQETISALTLTQVAGGVFKAAVYGVLVAIAGCLRGMESGPSASAVGEATTSAVVTSIVLVIGACGLFAVLFYILGI
jgi:phospholipid/cholesterol/gamma-HCH transport system permease protein